MDRDLTLEEHRKRRRMALAKAGLLLALIGVIGWTSQRLLGPVVDEADLLIETVTHGPFEATVTATGTVVPREQQTIPSPANAAIRTVFVSLGEQVKRGAIIMQLDTTASLLELHNLEERLARSRAALESQRLQLDDVIRQTHAQHELKIIDLESREATVARFEPLSRSGVVSQADFLEKQLEVKRARVEVRQLEAELSSLQQRQRAELDGLKREYTILDAQRADQARRVAMSAVQSPVDGIVTAIVPKAGAVVAEGSSLATVAAQNSFSVEAGVSDYYAPQLKPGQTVRVRAATNTLAARLLRILPTGEASRLTLFIELDNPAAANLYANLRVEAEIVVASKEDVLQVRRGPGLDGGSGQVWVINDNHAVRKAVRLGLSGSQQLEVTSGLTAGERVIVSDMKSWADLSQIRIRH